MKKEEVIIGMKVFPFQKTAWGSLEGSCEWEDAKDKAKNYLYVVDWDDTENCFILSSVKDEPEDGGDFYNPEDFKPYDEVLADKI